jgi:hypothetical protein
MASETFEVIGSERWPPSSSHAHLLTTVAKRVLYEFWRRRDLERAYCAVLEQLPESHMPSAEDRALLLESLDRIAQAFIHSTRHRAACWSGTPPGSGWPQCEWRPVQLPGSWIHPRQNSGRS